MFFAFINTSGQVFAQSSTKSLPTPIQKLLNGQTLDYTAVVTQLSDSDLPVAISVIDFLNFKSVHQEIHLTPKEVSHFKRLLFQQITDSSSISFSETESCSKKVPETTIIFEGQSILIPEHYTSNANLAITSYSPAGEAGTIFPTFDIDVFTQSLLTKHSFKIDGKQASTYFLTPKLSSLTSSSFAIALLSDLSPKSMLSIGTHTAELTLANKSGEQVTKKWSFTVGVYDTSTPKLPGSAKVIKELKLDPKKILSGQKVNGDLSVIIYRDKNGNIYTEYKLTSSSGQTIKSRNLAFVRRESISTQKQVKELTISPKTRYAFKGNKLKFSYNWAGEGTVISEEWIITSGSEATTGTFIEMSGNTVAKCILIIEATYIDSDGEQQTFQFERGSSRGIHQLPYYSTIYQHHQKLILSNSASATFKLRGRVNCPDVGSDVDNEGGIGGLLEGDVYTFDYAEALATLRVKKLRWKLHKSIGDPKIQDPLSNKTLLTFNNEGCAEVVFDIKLTWEQFGETYESNFEPDISCLYAFYPIKAQTVFTKYPKGQVESSRRHLEVKSFDLEIKKQKRHFTNENDFELSTPIEIFRSSIWPASSPLLITHAELFLSDDNPIFSLGKVAPFTYLTPAVYSDKAFQPYVSGNFDNLTPSATGQVNRVVISRLPSIPIYLAKDLLRIQLDPSETVTFPAGKESIFTAEVLPLAGMGVGILSENEESLDILDGYRFSSISDIWWYEDLAGGEDDDWKTKAKRINDFSYAFDPYLGSGSYTMNCYCRLTLKESDTGDSVPVGVVADVPVEVTPGLNIFSPIPELPYPLNGLLKVKTSLDGSEDLETWQNIKWKLNGKSYEPNVSVPPFYIALDHVGEWTLEAEVKIRDPQTGKDIILKDNASFYVKPIEIRLSPARKVLDFNNSKSQQVTLSIDINGEQIEQPGEPIPWEEDYISAVFRPIEWSVQGSGSENYVTHDFKEESFEGNVFFSTMGAATIQATVTIELTDAEKLFLKKYPKRRDAYELPVLQLPAVRADVWAVTAGPMTNFQGVFPTNAIAKAYRTFKLDSFDFSVHSSSVTEHAYNHGKVAPEVTLKSAVPGVSITTSDADFKWSFDDVAVSTIKNSAEFVVKPKQTGSYNVSLESFLKFSETNQINIGTKDFPLGAVDFYSLIKAEVIPATFTIAFGERQLLTCEIKGAGTHKRRTVLLLDGAYKLKREKIEWLENHVPLKQSVLSSVYEYFAEKPGITKGKTEVTMVVNEVLPNGQGTDSDEYVQAIDWECNVSDQKAIIINPLESMIYPLYSSLKVVSNFDSADNWRDIKWKLNGKNYKPDVTKPPFYLYFDHVGKWKLEAELTIKDEETGKEVNLKDSVNFTVKSLDINLSPSRSIIDFSKNKTQLTKLSISSHDNTSEAFQNSILWDAKNKIYAKVTNIAWSAVSNENCATLDAQNNNFNGNVNFSSAGAATVQATVTVELMGVERLFHKTHPNYKGKLEPQIFAPPAVRADIWAVETGPMTDVQGKFPNKAIVGIDRTFEVNSFGFKVNGDDYAYSQDKGLKPEVILAPAMLGVPSVNASSLLFSWSAESLKRKKKANDGSKFVFKPSLEKKHEVKFASKLNFSGQSIDISEKAHEIDVVSLASLIYARVDPSSFTLNLGESQLLTCQVWSDDNPEPEPPVPTSKNKKFTILKGAYEVEITKVEWAENTVPSKQLVEAGTYKFIAKKPGKVKGNTIVSFTLREIPQNGKKKDIANYTRDITWQAFIKSLNLRININGKPAGSQNYYLGQRIKLSYDFVDSNEKSLKLDSPKWEISGEKLKEYHIQPIGTSVTNKILTSTDLSSDELSVFLYCLSGENFNKTINLQGTYYGKPFAVAITIEVTHPEVLNRPMIINQPDMFVKETSVYLGYNTDQEQLIEFNPRISNQTDIAYSICFAQVFMNNHWAMGSDNTEYTAQTLPLENQWLDRYFPYALTDAHIESKDIRTLENLYNDTPSIGLPHTSYKEIKADASYTLLLMVRPSQDAIAHKDICWVPLKAYEWSWSGHAIKHGQNIWKKVIGSFGSSGFKEVPVSSVLNWTKVGIFNETYGWKEKKNEM